MSGLFAIDGKGRRRSLKAEALEVVFDDGCSLHLVVAANEIRARAGDGETVMLVQPLAENRLCLRLAQASQAVDKGRCRLSLSVQKALRKCEAEGVPRRRAIRKWVRAALEQDAAVTVRIVDEVEGRALNAAFRGKDYATNVLTFVYDETSGLGSPQGARLAGDVVLCAPVVAAEALAQDKALEAHYAHLVVHGILHLQGYDHEEDREAERMESREREILANLGYPDPYASEAAY